MLMNEKQIEKYNELRDLGWSFGALTRLSEVIMTKPRHADDGIFVGVNVCAILATGQTTWTISSDNGGDGVTVVA